MQKQVKVERKVRKAWEPPLYSESDMRAVQALGDYAANLRDGHPPSPEQVKQALDWIIHSASGYYEVFFEPNQQDVQTFLAGRRFVGSSIIKLLSLKVSALFRSEVKRK